MQYIFGADHDNRDGVLRSSQEELSGGARKEPHWVPLAHVNRNCNGVGEVAQTLNHLLADSAYLWPALDVKANCFHRPEVKVHVGRRMRASILNAGRRSIPRFLRIVETTAFLAEGSGSLL